MDLVAVIMFVVTLIVMLAVVVLLILPVSFVFMVLDIFLVLDVADAVTLVLESGVVEVLPAVLLALVLRGERRCRRGSGRSRGCRCGGDRCRGGDRCSGVYHDLPDHLARRDIRIDVRERCLGRV